MRYKVLWIDDEYKKQLDFIGEAEQEGIDIDAFESHEEGIAVLNKNLDYYHAVILDAKVKNGKGDTVTSIEGLRASRDRLVEINNTYYLPYFIFTGQPDYTTNEVFAQSFGDYYIKALHNERLFGDLKVAIEKKAEYIIQKKHENIFSVCSEKYIGENAKKDLLLIFKSEANISTFQSSELFLNSIRKIVEDLFTAFNRTGILPDEFVKGGVILNASLRFINGLPEKEYILTKPILPKVVSDNLKQILAICQNGSHRLEVDDFIKKVNSPYLLLSITYQLADVLLWFKTYLDENPDKHTNILSWSKIESEGSNTDEWIRGYISRIAVNGWGTFKSENAGAEISIPPTMMKSNKLNEQDQIEITTQLDSSGTKKHVNKIKKQIISSK